MSDPQHGMKKHVAVPRADDTTSRGQSWDVWRKGIVIAQGIATRRRARRIAQQLDIEEAEPEFMIVVWVLGIDVERRKIPTSAAELEATLAEVAEGLDDFEVASVVGRNGEPVP